MVIDKETGLIEDLEYIPSPNCDPRSQAEDINLLVIHNISLPAGQFGGDEAIKLFTNCLPTEAESGFADLAGLCVSSHLFIRRDGYTIQLVPLLQRAWHAGVSRFEQREACNDFSIGIELEGTDTIPYEIAQYAQLVELSYSIMQAYPGISLERIVGHSDIAPQRKTDPGPAFDWSYYLTSLKERCKG